MIVNTGTGKLTINKTERGYLSKAAKILLGLAKHGEGSLSERSETGAQAIDEVIDILAVEETAEV